jgi:hypothetical protein
MYRKIFAIISSALILSGCATASLEERDSQLLSELKSASLTIYYSPNAGEMQGGTAEMGSMYTLTCLEGITPQGIYPDVAKGCANLLEAYKAYMTLMASQQDMCTMIYGGPEKASITGSLNGILLDIELERSNGCKIAEWETWMPILGEIMLAENSSIITN